jgi:hypothetical protein
MPEKTVKIVLSIWIALNMVLPAQAAVSVEQARRLEKDLTPFGAQRAGNADGSIPTWQGGLTAAPEGVTYDTASGDHLPNPFAKEKPLYTISAQNMDQYADKLTSGQKALLKKYPDTYKLHVYPTHRTAAAPQWVYNNTAKNAVNAVLTEDGEGVFNAFGGIPFPLAQKGAEAIFNHFARWNGGDSVEYYTNELVHADGSRTTCGGGKYIWDWPYYDKEGSAAAWDGWLGCLLIEYQTPANRKGEIILAKDPLDYTKKKRAAWRYIPGQRRVRRVPNMGYDTPSQTLGGLTTSDDAYMYTGAIDRYNWTLKGKREMMIPYHNYNLELATLDQVLPAGHINSKYVRWELHRVWIVEATLKKGKRHIYGKRVMHLDEDTWTNVLEDKYDTRGKLWRTAVGYTIMDWTVPALFSTTRAYYDLQRRDYGVSGVRNGIKRTRTFTDVKAGQLTPQHIRKLGRR